MFPVTKEEVTTQALELQILNQGNSRKQATPYLKYFAIPPSNIKQQPAIPWSTQRWKCCQSKQGAVREKTPPYTKALQGQLSPTQSSPERFLYAEEVRPRRVLLRRRDGAHSPHDSRPHRDQGSTR